MASWTFDKSHDVTSDEESRSRPFVIRDVREIV